MQRLTIASAATLAGAILLAAACGGSSSSTSDEGGSGSDSGGTGQGGGTGGSGLFGGDGGTVTGGTSSGTAGCGPCLRIACPPPVSLTVMPDGDAGVSPIADVTIDLPGVAVPCNPNGSLTACIWNCWAYQTVPTGHHTATVSAPGYESQTVEFDITSPTNCGCCGCGCQGYIQRTVYLRPTGDPVPGCCAALETDPGNCGACGRSCSGQACIAGECGP